MTAITLWVLTYLLQSTLMLGGAWLVTRLFARQAAVAETVWRVALCGSIVAPLLVAAGLVQPLSGTVALGGLWRPPVSGDVSVTEIMVPAAGQPVPGQVSQREGTALELSPGATATASKAAASIERGPALRTDMPLAALAARDFAPNDRARTAMAWSGTTVVVSWAAIAGAILIWHFVRRGRLFALLADRQPVTDAAIVGLFGDLCAAAGLRRRIAFTSSPACPVPMALTASEVCVPARFLHDLDREQQHGALAHEIAHVARRDPQWLTADAVVGAIFFFQPLNHVARRALREQSEWQCDEWAARHGAALGLARCLAEVATWLQPFPPSLLAVTIPMASRSDLVPRVERLLSESSSSTPGTRLRPVAVAVSLVAAVAIAAPAFSAGIPAAPPGDPIVPAPAVRQPADGETAFPDAGVAVLPAEAAQAPVIRSAPRNGSLSERWNAAVSDARSRSPRGFWIGYSFAFPLKPKGQHVSDSAGLDLQDFDWAGITLGQQLGTGIEDGIAVLVHYRGGRDGAIDRITHRSLNAPMPFDGAVVYWLGNVDDRESVPWLDSLQQRLRATDLRSELIEALAMHGSTPIVLPVLERLLASEPDAELRTEAAEGLEWHDVPASLELATKTARGDRDVRVREEAAEAIGGILVPGAVDVLVELANADEAGVRNEAAEALGEQPAADALRGIEAVVFGASHEDARSEAVEALGELDSGVALPLLRRIIAEHPSAHTRVEAVETLGDLEDFDPLPDLTTLVEQSADREVRNEALEIVAGLDSPAAYALLLRMATEATSAETRRDALDELGNADRKSRTAAEFAQAAILLERVIFSDPDESVQEEAVDAVQHLPRSQALALLKKVVDSHSSRHIRREALDKIEDIEQKNDER